MEDTTKPLPEQTPESSRAEPSPQVENLLTRTIEELKMIPSSLLARAVGEDRETIERLLRRSALLTAHIATNSTDEAAKTDLRHVVAALSDISTKYQVRAQAAVEEATNRFLIRAISFALDAALPVP